MQTRNDQRLGSLMGPQTTKNFLTPTYGQNAHGTMYFGPQFGPMPNMNLPNGQMHGKDMNGTQAVALENLTHAFGGMGMANNFNSAAANKFASTSPVAGNAALPALQNYFQLPDGRILVSTMGAAANPAPAALAPWNASFDYGHGQAPHPHPGGQAMIQGGGVANHAPAWAAMNAAGGEMPDLATARRNSYSSNEEGGPHTPFFGGSGQGQLQPKIAVTDISPQAWSTPSPQTLVQAYYPQQLAKSSNGQYTVIDLDAICQREPPIPRPVTAMCTGEGGRGTLEKSLINQRNTTNVYIRGLHPDTTDEMLHAYGERFGDIMSAKSMLDQQTNLCKGFGFIRYHNFTDGENCIRGFFHWGYEAKWARVSHNEKLKTLGDPENTNLYVSNLPVSFNEHSLMALFDPTPVLSSKILRDSNGMSRGVGFARFATSEICHDIIEKFNGKPVGEEGLALGIRFADTSAQKQLKTITAERRQYKTNEYNMAVYGATSPYQISPSTATFPSPLQPRVAMGNGYWPQGSLSPIYPSYPQGPQAYNPHVMNSMSATNGSGSENIPTAIRTNSRVKIESPSAVALAKRAGVDISALHNANLSDSEDLHGLGITTVASSPAKSGKETSPFKISPAKSVRGRI